MLMSRFKDNGYLVCLHNPTAIVPIIREGIPEILQVVYGLRLKWETHGDMVTLGEGKMGAAPNGSLLLLRKSSTSSLHMPVFQSEWGTWVDHGSPHSRLIWRSQFPDL